MTYLVSNWTPIVLSIAIFFIALLVFSVVKLRHNKPLAEKLCYYVLFFALLYKTCDYFLYCIVFKNPWYSQIPVEISQLAYFLCPIAYLSKNKWLKDGGAFLGIIAGGVQLVSIVVAPYRFAEAGNSITDFLESTIMHYMVLWGGTVQVCCIEQLKIKNLWKNYLVFLFVLLWGVLAANTWMFGTDAGHPNEPANIGFIQRCDMLPDSILEKAPWLKENHLFIIPFLIVFFIVTAAIYTVSYFSMRNLPQTEPSIYGMGWDGFRKFMKTDIVAPKEEK